jgi:lipoprotein-anchoring transpeptidase ErfK/SrfK
MKLSHITRNKPMQCWLAVLGTGLMLLLSACGGTATKPSSHAPPKIHVEPLSSQFLHARATAQTRMHQFQQFISQAERHGINVAGYQMQLQDDRQEFQNAQTLQDYTSLSTAVQAQAIALGRGVASYDLQSLQALMHSTDSNNDYEYYNAADAYTDQQVNFQNAQTLEDYKQIDDQAQILLTNLNALLLNLGDKTAHNKPHATDLQLIQTYHLTGKVIVVSLTEQTLREYKNGKLVGWMYVVTGQRAAQTPPGLWHVLMKGTNLIFKSDDPPGSALWYPPTHINYGMLYHEGGYFLHDSTWRSYFGPGANLPHADYTSGQYSDNGTHGCINMTLDDTIKLYDWTPVGTPVIVY